MKSVFEFKNYQSFLLYFFHLKRGNQARLAEFINCRSSFLTQVIDQKVGLSFQQATLIPNFLGLNKNEKMAFLLMVQKEKISDSSEVKFLDEQIDQLRTKNNSIKERLNQIDELPESEKAKYYSSWIYGAVHILCAFNWINSVDDIVSYLKIERSIANECVKFLLNCELIQIKSNRLSIGKKQIHLGEDSPFIFNHHINWRIKTIEQLALRKKHPLNFSSLIGISRKDSEVIKELLLKTISDINHIVQKSGEESAYLVNMDLLDLS